LTSDWKVGIVIELQSKAKYRRWKPVGNNKGGHNDAGTKHSARLRRQSGWTKSFRKEMAERAIRERDSRNTVTLVLLPSGKKRFRRGVL
jgi:hypothetical protein